MAEISSVCVYCGTGEQVDPAYKASAADLGRGIGAGGLRLVYGGGKVGLMGIVSEAAFDAGAEVVGIIPEHIQTKEIVNTKVMELHVVDSMHTRKRLMVEKSDAFIVLPGGFGTLDETFEILTWKYLKLHDKPVVFVNVKNYWDPLLDMVRHMAGAGFVPPWHRDLFQVAQSAEEALAMLRVQEAGHIKPNFERM